MESGGNFSQSKGFESNFSQSKGFEGKFKISRNEHLAAESAEKPGEMTSKLQIPFLKEIENLQNYQNLKNQ